MFQCFCSSNTRDVRSSSLVEYGNPGSPFAEETTHGLQELQEPTKDPAFVGACIWKWTYIRIYLTWLFFHNAVCISSKIIETKVLWTQTTNFET